MYLPKNFKNIYPTVWQLGFVFLLTWQKKREELAYMPGPSSVGI